MQRVADALVRAVGDAGHRAQVVRREGPVEAHRSPSDDFLVLIDVDSIYAWQREITTIGDVCRPLLENRGSFIMAPVHLGNIVGSFGVKVITDIYPDQSVRDWPDLPLPLLHDPVSAAGGHALIALTECSGIVASLTGNEAMAMTRPVTRARHGSQSPLKPGRRFVTRRRQLGTMS